MSADTIASLKCGVIAAIVGVGIMAAISFAGNGLNPFLDEKSVSVAETASDSK